MDCIFCKIINNEIPATKVYENDLVLAFLDASPKSKGHTLIIPKKHFENFLDIDSVYLDEITKVAKKIYQDYKKDLNIDGVTFMQNNELGQEVKHYHLHLIPRYKGEEDE